MPGKNANPLDSKLKYCSSNKFHTLRNALTKANQNVASPALSHAQGIKGTLDTQLHDAQKDGKFREHELD